jgi:arabinofuranosyltransferase
VHPVEPTTSAATPNDAPRGWWVAWLVTLPFWAFFVNRFWFLCDDAFITYRYSRNFALGYGPRYNLPPHETVPVEGYSDFLWMSLAALVEAAHGDVSFWMPWFSVGCGALLSWLVARTLAVDLRLPLPIVTVTVLGLTVFSPYAVWTTSGLETMPQAMLTYLTFYLLGVWRNDRWAGWAGGLAGLGLALVRTEGIAWAILTTVMAVGARALSGRAVLRPLGQFAAVLVPAFAAYYAWRYSYYESLVSNTALAKVHPSADSLLRGGTYVGLYFATMVTPLLWIPGVPAALRRDVRWIGGPAALMALAFPAYAVAVSGDYMAYFRMLVPGLSFLAVTLALLADAVWRSKPVFGPVIAVAAGAGAAYLGALPAFNWYLLPESTRETFHVRFKLEGFRSEYKQWQVMREHTETWREKGLALKEYAKPTDRIVAAAIGNVGYYSDLFVYDRNGLVNREVAMLPDEGPLRSPGHDKMVEREFFFKYKPELLDARVVSGPKLRAQILSAVREIDGLGALEDGYVPDVAPLTSLKGRREKYIVSLRRVPHGEDPEAALEAWRQRMEEIAPRAAGRARGDEAEAELAPDAELGAAEPSLEEEIDATPAPATQEIE